MKYQMMREALTVQEKKRASDDKKECDSLKETNVALKKTTK